MLWSTSVSSTVCPSVPLLVFLSVHLPFRSCFSRFPICTSIFCLTICLLPPVFPSIRFSISLSDRSSVDHLFFSRSLIHPPISNHFSCQLVFHFICLYVCPCVCPPVFSSICLFVHIYIHRFVGLPVLYPHIASVLAYRSICLAFSSPIHPSACPPASPSIRSSIYSKIFSR